MRLNMIDKLQPYSGQEKVQCQFNDTDAFVLSVDRKNYYQRLKKS